MNTCIRQTTGKYAHKVKEIGIFMIDYKFVRTITQEGHVGQGSKYFLKGHEHM